MWAGEQALIVDEIEEFLTGVRPQPLPDRVLATVLFTDIVGSTERPPRSATVAGATCSMRTTHVVRGHIERARGRVVDTKGDGFLATFDGPARAILCARDIVRDVQRLGIDVRRVAHGEIELVGDDIAGSRSISPLGSWPLPTPGEVLVSSTVRDLSSARTSSSPTAARTP